MFNKAILMGRICNDLVLKTTPQGTPVLSFTVACDRRYQEKGKDKVSDFFNCIAWRNEAEFISKFWAKGRMILVEGELQTRKYTDKNGIERYVTELIVDRATFTGEKTERQSAPLPEEPPQYRQQNTQQNDNSASSYTAEDFEQTDEGYPF